MSDKDFAKDLPRRIVIVGDGVEAWLTALILNHRMLASGVRITVLADDSSEPVTPIVSLSPGMAKLFSQLGVDESEVMRECKGTYSLGVQYCDWSQLKRDYWHPFGICGAAVDGNDVFLLWHSERAHGRLLRPYQSYSLNWAASVAGKSPRRRDSVTPIQKASSYGFNLDRAAFLRWSKANAIERGVEVVNDKVCGISPNGRGGIAQLKTNNSGNLPAEFFLDCAGPEGSLLQRYLDSPFVSWADRFICDRVLSGVTEVDNNFPPYTRCRAMSAGSATAVTLSEQTHHVMSYSSNHSSENDAERTFIDELRVRNSDSLLEKKFSAGCQSKFWQGNVLAIGSSACRVDAVDCSSVLFAHYGIEMFLRLMPDRNKDQLVRDTYNERMGSLAKALRDIAQLRFHLSKRAESEFWRDVSEMELSSELTKVLGLYNECGFVEAPAAPHVTTSDLYYVFTGNSRLPRRPSGMALSYSSDDANEVLRVIQKQNEATISNLPSHQEYLQEANVLKAESPMTVRFD